MTKPDWNQSQKPNEKSPKHEHGPKQAPDDLSIVEPVDDEPAAVAGEPLAGATVTPSSHIIPNVPPVTNQGTTPQCVAYSNAYDQNQQDRPELGRFNQMNQALFFNQIGGTSNGAYMTAGLDRRKAYGYPEKVNVPAAGGYPAQDGKVDTATHEIAGYSQIALTPTAIKAALMLGHGVLLIGDWFHSWFHPFASGKLPAPDYKVGGHAIWCDGWNDSYGLRLHNSWGTAYGVAGDVFLPYAFLTRFYAAYRTTDK